MNNVDLLITDISSIFFDYLLLQRPIIFLIKNKNFQQKIPLRFDLAKTVPGFIASNWTEVILEIENILNNKDNYILKRKKISSEFNHYNDNCSSERIFKELKI